ncbi:hypothetical protein [Helicobacter rodentium]|uniref:hypothetical protein n=1 Tax=Helicobacter rodentium TaxID=59617 RepID=UPI00235728AC|nr:hypothetical protein [Helicobacter rodentium]
MNAANKVSHFVIAKPFRAVVIYNLKPIKIPPQKFLYTQLREFCNNKNQRFFHDRLMV